MKWFFALLVAALVLLPRQARAQQYIFGASGEVADGIEGGGAGSGFGLARVRLRIGVDWRVDEFPQDIFQIGLLTEIIPHTSVGVDGRYARMLGKKWEVNLGGVGILFPASLFGPLAGLRYHLPLSGSSAILLGPELNVFAFGSDLPGGTVIWQALLQAGIHVDL